MQAKCLNVV